MQPKQIVTPKAFYVSERDRFYTDWTMSFWRELFQNSVDAGAKNIRITVAEEAGRGSFGRAPAVDQVVRIRFEDDGCGMDKAVLNDVYFAPGETTKKDGEFTGGYGRARLMTCFSQVRYAIRTHDCVVEGDGPEYVNMHVADARGVLTERRERLREEVADAAGRGESVDPTIVSKLAAVEADLSELDRDGTFYDGCRIEVDINPNEHPDRPWLNTDLGRMLDRLNEYLGQSQLPCKVFINGQEHTDRCRRGPAKRQLVTTNAQGSEVAFATVHLSQSPTARHKGQVIVRVGGAAMFTKSISSAQQAIIEIDRKLSRDVMTSNRDSLRGPYDAAFQAFLEDLSVDVRSALKDQEERKHIRIEGGLGRMRAERNLAEIAAEMDFASVLPADAGADAAHSRGGARPIVAEQYESHSLVGIPDEVLDAFARRIAAGEETFLKTLVMEHLPDGAYYRMRYGIEDSLQEGNNGRKAIAALPPEIAGVVAAELRRRFETELQKLAPTGLSDLHDIHMQIEAVNPKVRKAIYRNDPRNWDYASGKGQAPRALLAAWTTCCEQAIKTLMKIEPELKPFEFATGWYYGKPEGRWLGDNWKEMRTEAQHHKRDDVHVLLLNPTDEDGRMAINPATPEGRQRIIALALHEVAHICSSRHDEYFAYLQTKLLEAFDMREANKAMQDAVKAVRSAYAEGKAKIQRMDEKTGIRPAERLLAHAAPVSTMMAGLAASEENRDFPADNLRHAYGDCFRPNADGTVDVDCDALGNVEEMSRYAMRRERDRTADLREEARHDADLHDLSVGDPPLDARPAVGWR